MTDDPSYRPARPISLPPIDLRGGLPGGKHSRGLPRPFQRHSISIGSERRREWAWVPAGDIEVGDIVADLGEIQNTVLKYSFEGSTVRLDGPEQNRLFSPSEVVYAFVHLTQDPE
jgi:hypothetical protein